MKLFIFNWITRFFYVLCFPFLLGMRRAENRMAQAVLVYTEADEYLHEQIKDIQEITKSKDRIRDFADGRFAADRGRLGHTAACLQHCFCKRCYMVLSYWLIRIGFYFVEPDDYSPGTYFNIRCNFFGTHPLHQPPESKET